MYKKIYMFLLCLFLLNINVYGDTFEDTVGIDIEIDNSLQENQSLKKEINEYIAYLSSPVMELSDMEFLEGGFLDFNLGHDVGDDCEDCLFRESNIDVLDLYNQLSDLTNLESEVYNTNKIQLENTLLTTQEVVEKQVVSVNTFDILNYSHTDGPCELLDVQGDTNIVKYYQMVDTISGIRIPLSYYVVKNTVDLINIKDEQSYNNFKLVDWFTSTDNWTPSGNEVNSVYTYNSIKAVYNNGNFEGSGEQEINLENLSDRTLHLLYEYRPVKTVFNIVKLDSDLNVLDSITLNKRPDNDIYNVDLFGYNLDYYVMSQNSTLDLENLDLSLLGEKREVDTDIDILNIPSEIKSLYLVYEEVAKNTLVLYGNELSHKYTLSDLVGNENLLSVYDYVPSGFEGKAYAPVCLGHVCNVESCVKVHKCYSHDYGSRKLSPLNNTWTVSVNDSYDYNNLTTFVKDYKVLGKTSKSGITDWYGGNGKRAVLTPDAEFVLYRQYDIDKVTLYPGKNNDLKEELLSIGLNIDEDSSYKPLKKRAAQDTFTEESFYNTLVTHWVDGDERDTTLSWTWDIWCEYGTESVSGVYNTHYENGHSPDDLNAYYSYENNFQTNYYIGKSHESNISPVDYRVYGGEDLGYNMSVAGKNLRFYPYYEMQYMDSNSDTHSVYVLAENESSLRLFNSEQINRVTVKRNLFESDLLDKEILFYKDYMESLQELVDSVDKMIESDSTEESIEETVEVDNLEESSENIAEELTDNSIQLEIDKTINKLFDNIVYPINLDDSVVKVITYYPCLRDDVIESVQKYGFKKSETELMEEIALRLEEFNSLYLDQSTGHYTNILTQYEFIIESNGYFTVEKNGEFLISENSLDKILSNNDMRLLDENTKILTNLWAVLEHGENTSDRNGEKWYFECFDGLKVYSYNLTYY